MSLRPEVGIGAGRAAANKILVVGGSAGALTPLTRLVGGLRPDRGIAGLVILHRVARGPNVLPSILNRNSVFRATEPVDGDPLHPDYIYVASADRHLELERDSIRVNRGPRVNGQRPAIDVLFESAARAYGPAVVGVLLSGTLDDGGSGLLTIRRAGGQAIVQDPEEADFDEMPRAAIQRAGPVRIAAVAELPEVVADALDALPPPSPVPATARPDRVGSLEAPLGAADEEGMPIGVTCPECGGSLWLSDDPYDPVVRCRIGHRISPATLQALQSERLERALWAALRALEEQVAVGEFMEEMHRRREDSEGAERHRQRREFAAGQAEMMRRFLLGREGD